MSEEKKKMSTGKKVLIGVGIYLLVGIVAAAIILTLDDKKNAAKAEVKAQARIDEMDAIYESHDPEVFRGYALAAGEKQGRVVVDSVQPDVDFCVVEATISGYVYSMSDDGADADGMVAAACLFALDCSQEMFSVDEHLERIDCYFRVKDKIGGWLDNAVSLIINRSDFEKIDYDTFRAQIQNDYNEIKKIAVVMPFGGNIEQRLKNYRR